MIKNITSWLYCYDLVTKFALIDHLVNELVLSLIRVINLLAKCQTFEGKNKAVRTR